MPRPARGRLARRPGVIPAPAPRATTVVRWGSRPRAARPGARPGALVVALGFLAVALMLTLAARATAVARLGYEIGNLERQIDSLERAGEKLRLEGAQLGAVARIEEQASTRLSMTRPQEVRLVMAPAPAVNAAVAEGGSVTFLATPAEPGAVYAAVGMDEPIAGPGGAEDAAGTGSDAGRAGWFARLAAALLRWLPSTAPVEATPLP